MLDNLVESKDRSTENKRISEFILTTFLTIMLILLFALIYSLFSQSLALGSADFNVSSLIAPIAVTEEIKPQPEKKAELQPTEKSDPRIISRIVNMPRTDESPFKPPDSISVTKNVYQTRPDAPFVLGKLDSNPPQAISTVGTNSGGSLTGLSKPIDSTEIPQTIEMEKPPVIKQTAKPSAEKTKLLVSGSVVNSKAINLVKPVYSSAARAIRASGEVKVQVMIDEDGKVISASAVSGHPLLRNSAEVAAKASKFTPTTLSDQKVKVTGIIIYHFAVQ